jgi:fructose-1,6-bisphosphatase I
MADGEGGAVGKESINTEIVTLTRFLNEEQVKHKEATGEFTYVETNAHKGSTLRHQYSDFFAMPSNSPLSR